MTPAPLPVGPDGAARRRAHIEAVRRAVEAGTYRVDAGDVADAIVRAAVASRGHRRPR